MRLSENKIDNLNISKENFFFQNKRETILKKNEP